MDFRPIWVLPARPYLHEWADAVGVNACGEPLMRAHGRVSIRVRAGISVRSGRRFPNDV